MPTVQLPNGQTASYPEGMSSADIQKAIESDPNSGAKPEPGMLQKAAGGVGDFFGGIGSGALHTLATIGYPAGMAAHAISPKNFPAPSDESPVLQAPNSGAGKVGRVLEQAGEFLLPGGAEEEGATKLAEMAPWAGRAAKPLAKILASGISSGGVNAAQGGSPVTGALMGGGGQVLGQGLKAVAPALAETALKVRGNQRLFGRTVGDAILNDTSGIRPESIGKSANATISQLSPELDAADQASMVAGKRGTLEPARASVTDAIAAHTGNRAMKTAAGIQPISDFLTRDQLTGLPLAEQQTAPGLRMMKRGLNEDYIHNWTSDQPPAQKLAARQAYGNINEQLHSISPETSSLDQRISSLIPAKLQGERVAAGAPLTQRIAGRFGAHTGALAGGLGGAFEGRREGGTPGMIAGGLAGLIAPELISSPEAQMVLARTLNKANGLRPLVGGALQLDRKKGEQ